MTFTSTPDAKKFETEPFAQVSYSVEKDYFDDWKSILAEIKGEDIDITSERGEEQGSKSPFSLLSEPISRSSLLFISSSRSIQFNSPYSQLFFFSLLPTFSTYFSLLPTFFGHFSLLPILFLPPLLTAITMKMNSKYCQPSP